MTNKLREVIEKAIVMIYVETSHPLLMKGDDSGYLTPKSAEKIVIETVESIFDALIEDMEGSLSRLERMVQPPIVEGMMLQTRNTISKLEQAREELSTNTTE